ncbi:putative GTP-binding protein 6 isoform X1 [Sinocyclocheilus anshuiensis]|uniref:putative GTP-binding protein 6 isoform X1 n=1 Tax=Sinocyclocheilus anshuiensis TaxID=1608454 RepID=UPI0007BA7C65|nr:PREDICTED: putative GTP-binding protein 6 isoform X1 [Sinocyclocheilus anshuiensis]
MNSNKIGVLAKHVFLCRYAWRELCTKHVLGRRYMTFAKCKPIRFSQCTSKLSTAFAVLPARTLSLTACMFKRKNHNTDNSSLEKEEVENDEAEIEELFQQQIPTGIGEEEHRVFIVHPDVKWGSRKQYLTTAALQMEEAVGLVNTLYNWSVADKIILSTKTPEKRRIFGKGNFQTLTEKIRATPGVTAVFVNVERFSPSSEKELQEAWGVKVLDRYSLVLHIFRCNARTKEAKLQISLAEIPLLRSRLRNEVANLDQQGGGSRYIMGSGETLYEMQQRLLKERELKIRSALERLRRKRHLLRSQRKHRDFPIVSVMGYTNCVFVSKGKTTLIKALTGDAGLQPKDQLFATLDVTVHAGQLPSHMTVLYIDTIGFLSQLPHQLIDSFSATLEDVTHSDLLIHVRDISHPETVNQKVNVLNVLKNLQIPERLLNSIIEVHNKIDLIEGYEVSDPEVIPISALKQHGLELLKEKIEEAVVKYTGKQTMTLKVQLNSPQLAWLYKEATVQAVDNVGDDCTANVKVIISQAAYGRYRKLFQVT